MSEGRVHVEKRGHVTLIGLDRAAKMNAFDLPMLAALAKAYTAYEEDEDARCAVLHARGDHFTAGLDLAQVGPTAAAGEYLFAAGEVDPLGLHGRVRSKPVVCAVQGRCLTIGIELVLAQDITVASEDTRFAQIEIKRGIYPFGGATVRFLHLSGWGNAMRYLLTGDEFDAREAHRIGLVQEVAPRGEALDRAIAIAETIAAQSPLGVRATLASARRSLEEGFRPAADALMPEVPRLMASDDAKEGLRSFVERRTAKFTGR